MHKIKSNEFLALKIFGKKCYAEPHPCGWMCECIEEPYIARTGDTMTDATLELKRALERDTRLNGLLPAARLLYDQSTKSYRKLAKYYWYKFLQGRKRVSIKFKLKKGPESHGK